MAEQKRVTRKGTRSMMRPKPWHPRPTYRQAKVGVTWEANGLMMRLDDVMTNYDYASLELRLFPSIPELRAPKGAD